MLCYKVRKKLIPFVEGTLDARQAEAVEKHIKSCIKCAAELRAIRGAYSAFQEARTPAAEPAPDLWEKIEQKISASAEQKRSYSIGGIWRYAGATAAAAVLLAGIITVMTPSKINVPKAPTPNNILSEKPYTEGAKPAVNAGRVETGHKPAAKPSFESATKQQIIKKRVIAKNTLLIRTAKKPTVSGRLNVIAKSTLDSAKPSDEDANPAAPPTVKSDNTHTSAAGSPSLSDSNVSETSNMRSGKATVSADTPPRLGMSAGKPVAAETGRDWIECGTPSQTNVDILNNADVQSRIAAIFRYP